MSAAGDPRHGEHFIFDDGPMTWLDHVLCWSFRCILVMVGVVGCAATTFACWLLRDVAVVLARPDVSWGDLSPADVHGLALVVVLLLFGIGVITGVIVSVVKGMWHCG